MSLYKQFTRRTDNAMDGSDVWYGNDHVLNIVHLSRNLDHFRWEINFRLEFVQDMIQWCAL